MNWLNAASFDVPIGEVSCKLAETLSEEEGVARISRHDCCASAQCHDTTGQVQQLCNLSYAHHIFAETLTLQSLWP